MNSKQMQSIIKSLFVTITLIFVSCGHITGEKFDSSKWKNSNLNSEENWSLRWNMINSLRNDYELIGKTKNEIIDLLGKPDNESQTEISYYLGYSKRGINTGSLIFFIGKNRKVLGYNVWEG